MAVSLTHLNGKPATAADLAPLAFAGYAHFTAMQVRDRAVRGLDLHLERLRRASEVLFGQHLSTSRVREYLRLAVDEGGPDASVACFVTSRPGEFMVDDTDPALDVLIKLTDPAQPPTGPMALDVVSHQRHLAGIKHVGEVAKTWYLRQARARGVDDAVFEGGTGRLSEATIWNLAFWDGETVIWPQADLLPGVTMQILTRQLAHLGVAQQTRDIRRADLTENLACVLMNSWTPAIAVSHLGDRQLADGTTFAHLLHEAYRNEPPTRP
ncbi:aminotransferase class IV family protein [Verrucosispora sp. FIM060022]|uniref:aminotransferase class IV family protein n=1 Tax=Verrucosispora sp. FIM060022 TaxID=1479020 RepID=UPI000F87B064|nr:aminotransferase class IV family protein [Verrucosispora sp. FIM060022]RUL95091.1 branched-chain amino acid aminotransferase [Verrucosispora sp. FIM060022]